MDSYKKIIYLGLAQSISNNTVEYMTNRKNKDEYMQLMHAISRYKSDFSLENKH